MFNICPFVDTVNSIDNNFSLLQICIRLLRLYHNILYLSPWQDWFFLALLTDIIVFHGYIESIPLKYIDLTSWYHPKLYHKLLANGNFIGNTCITIRVVNVEVVCYDIAYKKLWHAKYHHCIVYGSVCACRSNIFYLIRSHLWLVRFYFLPLIVIL